MRFVEEIELLVVLRVFHAILIEYFWQQIILEAVPKEIDCVQSDHFRQFFDKLAF
jgi:hypothetical protein